MPTDETLTLVAASQSTELPSETLLVAVDDTGHELFPRTHHVFGLGGCACLVKHYGHLIDDPWRAMKAELFGGPDIPLHAAELNCPTTEQLEGLGIFFTKFQFFRFAVLAARTVENGTDHSLIKLVCRSLLDRVAEMAAYAHPNGVVIVVENSTRIGDDLIRELSGYKMGDGSVEFEPRAYLLPKSAGSSMLEVADFVMHAAGAQVRNRILGRLGIRKGFDSVFYQVDQRLSHYVELLSVKNAA